MGRRCWRTSTQISSELWPTHCTMYTKHTKKSSNLHSNSINDGRSTHGLLPQLRAKLDGRALHRLEVASVPERANAIMVGSSCKEKMVLALGLLVTLALSVFPRARAACPNLCSGHGQCGAESVCSCHDGWGYTADCSLRTCPEGPAFADKAVSLRETESIDAFLLVLLGSVYMLLSLLTEHVATHPEIPSAIRLKLPSRPRQRGRR